MKFYLALSSLVPRPPPSTLQEKRGGGSGYETSSFPAVLWQEVGRGLSYTLQVKKGKAIYRCLQVSHTCPPSIIHTHTSPPSHNPHTHNTQFKKHIGVYYNLFCSLLTLELKFEVRSLLRRVFVLIGREFNIASDDAIRSFTAPSW